MRSALLKKSWLVILLAFVLPLLLVYGWWGGFNSVRIEQAERGPYVYAYLAHSGAYAKIPETQHQVLQALRAQHVTPLQPISVLFDDPRHVPSNQLRAYTGFVVQAGDVIRPPLKRGEIPRRKVLLGQVKAAELLAPSKTYQALYDYLKTQQRDITMPAVELYNSPAEIYRIGEFTVEIQQ
jgi:DNA gyrase inhibitor GyrI